MAISDRLLDRMVLAARITLGLQYLLSGLNWFLAFLPMPAMGAPDAFPIKHAVVVEMIGTGWMFQLTKVVEVLAGVSLLVNRFVPLTLVVAMPVALLTFLLDAFIFEAVWSFMMGNIGWRPFATEVLDLVFGGLCVLLVHVFLLFCYFDHYRPMLEMRSRTIYGERLGATAPEELGKSARIGLVALGVPAIILASINAIWLIGMIHQWLIPWSSLRLLRLG